MTIMTKKIIRQQLEHKSDGMFCHDEFPFLQGEQKVIQKNNGQLINIFEFKFKIKHLSNLEVAPSEMENMIKKSVSMMHDILYQDVENELELIYHTVKNGDQNDGAWMIERLLKRLGE